ncbi:MAG TPA: hypothetical protein EYN06_00005, partial [Myxococcales bacterium]|nr:hypothetical protein [Myxococcales bacterium]
MKRITVLILLCIVGCGSEDSPAVQPTDDLGVDIVSEELGNPIFDFLFVDTGPQCGNDKTEGNEECDDGNLAYGDGCRPNCTSEGPWAAGDLIITEIMANPAAVSDSAGEW